jgi:dTDP-4-dehydrorhamnose reductase
LIWLIGNRGMLGSDVSRKLSSHGLPSIGSDREINITDKGVIREFVRGRKIHWIVNCAAYTAVDHAEEEPEAAFRLNAEGVGNIAELAESIGSRLIHISTDYVFNGRGTRPYTEDTPVNPMGVYGRSKAAGEKLALERCSRVFILRTAWLYGPHGGNFVFTMLKLMRERDVLKVVDDQVGSPTYTAHLAEAITSILQADGKDYGIYHFSNEGQATWFEFAREIYKLGLERGILTKPCTIEGCATNDFPTKAKRPAYSVLSKEKIKRVFGISIPSWRSGLIAFLDRLLEEQLL